MVTPVSKAFSKITGINSKRCEEIFWFLFERGEAKFNLMKRELKMNQKILSESLKKLMEKNIVIKTKDGKYALSPEISRVINPLLSFDYISSKQPAAVFINSAEQSSNIHLLYGFKHPSTFVKLIIEELSDGVDSLRELKHAMDENEKCLPRDALVYSIMHLWNKTFLYNHTIDVKKLATFMKRLAKEAIKISKEMNLNISWDMENFIQSVRILQKISSKYRIVDVWDKSNEVAILSVPSFRDSYPFVTIESIINAALNTSVYDIKRSYELFEDLFERRYGKLIKFFHLSPFLNKIWKYALVLHYVTASITIEHLRLIEHEFYKPLKEFPKKEVDLLWKIVKHHKEKVCSLAKESCTIPMWIQIVCYKGINEVWKNEKDRIFMRHYEKLKEFDDIEIYREAEKLPHPEKALLAAEYILGERHFKEEEDGAEAIY
ncbi:MAG: hypothetical protein J7L58_01280 [Thermoplasmata archaeon]|nr:hypothetical protein [Thermoplasmata archaeon]